MKLLKQAQDRYRKDAAATKEFGGDGEDAVARAAWSQLAGAVLASDTTILLY